MENLTCFQPLYEYDHDHGLIIGYVNIKPDENDVTHVSNYIVFWKPKSKDEMKVTRIYCRLLLALID